MQLLWVSNSPHTKTGYGTQTGLFAPWLAREHRLAILAYYGLEGAPMQHREYTILPRAHDPWGNDIVAAHASAIRADLVITLTDAWVLDQQVYGALPWLAWTPIDHAPVPPGVLAAVQQARRVVAMSRFGQAQLQQAGIAVHYIPHAFDPAIFHPLNRQVARQKMGWDARRFIVMMNAANKGDPSRKGLREALLAWREVIKSVPDALLYLHTERFGRYGVPLDELVQAWGLRANVEFVDDYRYACGLVTAEELNVAYNAADVLLNPAMGEGFGIPILEAQAAGTPVIVTAFSAMPELCWSGWQVEGTPFMTYQNAMQMIPSVTGIVEALRAAYEQRGDARLRRLAVEGAQAYRVEQVYRAGWQPLLQEIGEMSQGRL